MKIDFSKLSDVTGEITLTLEEKDYAEKVEKELKDYAKKATLPGFRPGHAPKDLIRRKFGPSLKAEAIQDTVGDALYNYIKENDLNVLGNPVADPSNNLDIEATEHTLKFKVGLAPEMTFKVDKDLHIPYYKIEVTDEMIDRQDEALRKRFGKQEPGDTVNETALVKGTITELNADGTVKEGGIEVENGIVSPQYFSNEDQRKLFLGKHVGDEVTFNPWATCNGNEAELSSMLNIDKDDVKNHQGDFLFVIKEIIVLNPAQLGEEFYKEAFGDTVKDETGYRAAVKAMIENSLTADENYRFSIDAQKAIRDLAGELELPDDILKAFLISQNEALTPENIDEEYKSIRDELVWDLEKDHVARQLDVKVTDEDLNQSARMIARQQFAQYGMMNVPDDALEKYADEMLKDEKTRNRLARQTGDMKVYGAIKEAVSADEKQVSVEEFNKLFTDAEESAAE